VKKTSGLSAESLALADSIAKRRLGIDDVFEPDESQKTSGNAAINQNGLWERLLKQESGTRQFDSKGNVVTSQVGALGISQVMPATAMDPGFGVPNVLMLQKIWEFKHQGALKKKQKDF